MGDNALPLPFGLQGTTGQSPELLELDKRAARVPTSGLVVLDPVVLGLLAAVGVATVGVAVGVAAGVAAGTGFELVETGGLMLSSSFVRIALGLLLTAEVAAGTGPGLLVKEGVLVSDSLRSMRLELPVGALAVGRPVIARLSSATFMFLGEFDLAVGEDLFGLDAILSM